MVRISELEDLNALLQACHDTRHTADAERLLERLLLLVEEQVIRPTAERQLGGARSKAEDVEDVLVVVKTKLATEVRKRRADPASEAIACVEAYARTMTRNACNDSRRQKAGRVEIPVGGGWGDGEGESLLARAPDTRLGPAEELLMRDTLRRLWGEIRRRPPRQRAALLLDWEEVGHIPRLLQLSGAATMAEMADALGMSVEELGALWYDLPLDGSALARRLGIERQQVYNLVMVARRTLRAWLKKEDEKA